RRARFQRAEHARINLLYGFEKKSRLDRHFDLKFIGLRSSAAARTRPALSRYSAWFRDRAERLYTAPPRPVRHYTRRARASRLHDTEPATRVGISRRLAHSARRASRPRPGPKPSPA